jgi:PAS domain S-box-containing protein
MISSPPKRSSRARIFTRLGRELGSVRTAREAAQIVAAAAEQICGWDAFVLDSCSGRDSASKGIYCVDTVDGIKTEISPGQLSARVSPIAQRVIDEGPLRILRGRGESFPDGSIAFGDKSRPSASLLYVPVRSGARVIGVLSIQSYAPGAYTEKDLNSLQTLADHCGGALERVWAEAGLRDASESLRMALAAAKMGTWTTFLEGKWRVEISPELEGMLGLSPGEFGESEEAFFEFIHPEDHKAVRQAFARAAESNGDYEVEFRFLPRGRASGWMLGRGRAYPDAGGRATRLAGVCIDITARKKAEEMVADLNAQLERRVGERTAELEASNHELEAFAYSVSHDLRAPLRAIRGFSEALLEHAGKQLDQAGLDYLQRVCESSLQMDRLIEELLKLSRASQGELARHEVNLGRLAELIASDLRRAEPQRRVRFKIAPDLVAWGDERLLGVVLDNLLRNAWKFTSARDEAVIELGVAAGPEPAFFVRDNGVGFDMRYADKLFGVFQRLHSTRDFPGTGVGLATVSRIVKRHGGRVWGSGIVNEGAIFYFVLPATHNGSREPVSPGSVC